MLLNVVVVAAEPVPLGYVPEYPPPGNVWPRAVADAPTPPGTYPETSITHPSTPDRLEYVILPLVEGEPSVDVL